MKPLDWILAIVAGWGLLLFIAGFISTPAIYFQAYPHQVWRALGKRFAYFLVPTGVILWRIYG